MGKNYPMIAYVGAVWLRMSDHNCNYRSIFFFIIIKCVGSICTMADRYPSTLNYVNIPSSVFFSMVTFLLWKKGE